MFSHETPSFLGVSLRLRPWLLARVCRLDLGCQECKKGKTVTIRGKLNGTNTGTSAPLTAPFFGRFPAPRRFEKPVHCRRTAPAPPADSKSQVSPERRCEPCTPKTRLTRGQESASSSIASNLPVPGLCRSIESSDHHQSMDVARHPEKSKTTKKTVSWKIRNDPANRSGGERPSFRDGENRHSGSAACSPLFSNRAASHEANGLAAPGGCRQTPRPHTC